MLDEALKDGPLIPEWLKPKHTVSDEGNLNPPVLDKPNPRPVSLYLRV